MTREIQVKSALHFHKVKYATNWDLNIYRGCAHRCQYCFAQYTHSYLQEEDFFGEILVKKNLPKILAKELHKGKNKGQPINFGGVTDCYQPLEKKYKITRRCLETALKYNNELVITTKSPLLLRDLDLISQLGEQANIMVMTSICTLDEKIRTLLEPQAPDSLQRFEMLLAAKKANAHTGLLLMPIIPYLTDNVENLELIIRLAKDYECETFAHSSLNLRGLNKNNFFNFLKTNFPHQTQQIQNLYRNKTKLKEYHQNLNQKISTLRKKYKMPKKKIPFLNKPTPKQLPLNL